MSLRCRAGERVVASHVMQAEILAARQALAVDLGFMELALAAANDGATAGEVPIGAVLVFAGEPLAIAHNAPIARSDPTAHAEIIALRAAARRARNYRLPGTTLYVTVEPCAMCVGAVVQARVERVVFGCADPKAGALGSVYDLGAAPAINHRFQVTAGVGAEAARDLLRQFFRLRRGA